ncbi:MAG TPA: ATP-dependent DNA ligase [Phycisphaerales bacterium]|nr:ATP-dependent DNA ligase [Phycisphaerales bacterium]
MRRFTRLYLDLDATNSTNEKVALLEEYLRGTPDDDAAWAVALLLGERPKGGASTRALRRLALGVTGLPEWLLGESYAAVGDLSETVALLVPGAGRSLSEPLHVTMRERVLPLAGADERERERLIREAWEAFGPRERLVYHKLARGSFRVGVQKKLVARALAGVAGVDPGEMTLRLSGPIRPEGAWYRALLEGSGERGMAAYPFYLAHQLDAGPHSLGDRADWQVEWKWDGVRAQVVRREGVLLWSRGEEPLTEQFPEIVGAALRLPKGTVLDGEILMWRGAAPLPFAELQRRLGRRVAPTHQGSLFARDEAAYLAFDLLEWNGQDMRAQPLSLRRGALEELIAGLPASARDTLRLSPVVEGGSWDSLAALRAGSRERGVEGFVLKRRDSAYGAGRTKGGAEAGWWKWKVDPYSADAVLLYAQPGTGRRASLLTDYTFAVWEGEGAERRLTPFAKAYSGLSNEEIEALDAWIRRHTVQKTGPVRQVEPTRVFEIHFEAIAPSERHRSGVAVRFPRIARERPDKRPEDADTLETLRGLLGAGNGP